MSYYSREDLEKMGFKYLGDNVKLSDKASFYETEKISIGHNSRIDDFCVISGNVVIGNYVHIAVFCNLAGGDKGIVMEDFSGLAYHVNVFTQSDDYSGRSLTNPTIPAKYKNESKLAIRINRHVLVGAGSIVFPGVTLGEGCAIGAMSLVTKDTIPWKIYHGIPASLIKDRNKDLLKLEKEFLSTSG